MDFPFLNKAFPDFPEGEVPLAIQAGGWEDASYQHDACPSFIKTGSNLQLYVNRLNPEDRYEASNAPRFNLAFDSDSGAEPCWLYVGESIDEVLAQVAAFEKGMGL